MTLGRMERRLSELREAGRTALVVYLTIGDPSVDDSLACAIAAVEAGADVLELGVPFSDPTADGPVIAAASHRAIAAGGSLRAALGVARELSAKCSAPLVLFSYLNPILAYGETRLPAAAAAAGVDALLVVDLPPEEGLALRKSCVDADVGLIPLVAPTTSVEREKTVVAGARGFVYVVSLTGVTGAGEAPLERAGERAVLVRERSGCAVVVGFGIDSPDKARRVARTGVDGVVVGSAVVRAIASGASRQARVQAVRELVSALRTALDAERAGVPLAEP